MSLAKKRKPHHEQRRIPRPIHLARVADDRYRRRRRLLSESPAMADPAFQHARLQPVDGRTDADWGLMALPPEAAGTPPHWLIYVGTPSVDASCSQAQGLGAKVLKAPSDIP